MKILLSPAKSIDTQRSIATPHYNVCKFIDDAQYLMTLQQQLSPNDLLKVFKISEKLATHLYIQNTNWKAPDSLSTNVKPCITVFTGEVYRGLNVETWTQDDFLYADKSIRILSGMYGILEPLDLLYPYRLEMGTRWRITEDIKNMYAYWGKRLATSLLNELQQDEAVINLASEEYYKAVNFKSLSPKVISIQFIDLIGDRYKTVSVYSKNARGKMARFVVKNRIYNPNELKMYNEDGYYFQEELSSEEKWVFIR